jgi:hypothetical protein
MRSIQTAGLVREIAQITRVDSRAVAQLNAAINIRGPGSRVPEMKRHRVNCEIQSIHSSGDPDEQAHPVVNRSFFLRVLGNDFKVAIYENLLKELAKTKRYERVFRMVTATPTAFTIS